MNAPAFGRPHTGRGPAGAGACPHLRLVALAETGTHAVVGTVLGPVSQAETQAAPALQATMDPSQCLLADRGCFRYALWTQAAATGAALVWRARQDLRLPVLAPCADGSYRSRLDPTGTARRRDQDGVDVRVMTYTLAPRGRRARRPRRNIACRPPGWIPPRPPAAEVAARYHERWAIEQIFDEFKTHPAVGGWCCAAKRPRACNRRLMAIP